MTVHKYGLSHKPGKVKLAKGAKAVKVKTLKDALESNGHLDTDVSYLKVLIPF